MSSNETPAIPTDIAEAVLRIGEAEWGATATMDADSHADCIRKSVNLTAEHFGQEGPQQMHGVYVKGTDVIIAHTGTSPNSPVHAQALTGHGTGCMIWHSPSATRRPRAMADLLDLAARVEAATGPDRGLDAEIAAVVRYFPQGVGFVWQASLTPNSPELGRVECCTSLGTGGPHYAAPAYTASLDAAMSLVPEDWHLSLSMGRINIVTLTEDSDDPAAPARVFEASASTPALALTAAYLRAIAEEMD